MKDPRFEIVLRDGTEYAIPRSQEPQFFEGIEKLTGLDRAMAEPLLLSGSPIEHPKGTYRFIQKGDA